MMQEMEDDSGEGGAVDESNRPGGQNGRKMEIRRSSS
jgi:hypothetical protein